VQEDGNGVTKPAESNAPSTSSLAVGKERVMQGNCFVFFTALTLAAG